MEYDVYGMENPLIDINVRVAEEDIKTLGLQKGTMHLIELEKKHEVLKFLEHKEHTKYPAGSCANTMMGLARLGAKAVFAGKVGDDHNGTYYKETLREHGIELNIASEEGLTGSSVIFVTPDSERTMTTYLGNCRKFSKKDINTDLLRKSKYLYFTGYLWDTEPQKEAAMFAIDFAKKNGIKIAFSFADPFVVKKNKGDFQKLLNGFDIIFANREEAESMTGTDVKNSIRILGEKASTVVITLNDKGSVISHEGRLVECNAYKTAAVDSTGAGDLYAAGFLYGMAKGLSLDLCGNLGSLMASWIVTRYGVRVEKREKIL